MTLNFKHYVRYYGEPKLKKPAQLKNINQEYTVDYIPGKCKCQVYIEGTNLWIKHRDYFSQPIKYETEDIGAPLEVLVKKYVDKDRKRKFVYGDSWGEIIARNEAWICLEDFIIDVKNKHFLDILADILRKQEEVCGFEKYTLECSNMSRMYEQIIVKHWDRNKIYW